MTARLILVAAVTLASLPACTPSPGGSPTQASSGETQAPAPSNRIDIPETVRRGLGLTFATVEARRVAQTLRVPGAFELQPRARHEYRMALSGRVQLLVDQYERVEVGQLLFRFQSPAWPELLHEIVEGEQAIEMSFAEIDVGKAKIQEARRKLELLQRRIDALAQADFKKADLDAEAAGLEASLPRLEAELRLAETRLANARRVREHALHRASTAAAIPEEELEKEVLVGDRMVPAYRTIDWIEVRASQAGIVEALAVTDGAFVEPPTNVVSTVDPERVRFRALALQADLSALAAATEAHIVPPRSPDVSIEAGVTAQLALGLEAHPKERTLTLIATPAELAPWIRPGVSAFLEVVVDSTQAPALAIPRSAIVKDGITHVFFRRDPKDPNKAIRVEADMGVSDGRWAVIHSGVVLGDEVIVAGAYELKLATEDNAVLQGQHVHADGTVH